MPRPVSARSRYVPALDGIRAIAVVAVILYHLKVPHASGGLLGVAVFFTLSGYLITGLLLTERERDGHILLGQFWLRRLRRLMPALVAVVVVVLGVTAVVAPDDLGRRAGEGGSALLYVNNWWVILRGTSYFDLFAGPGPLDHLWSLSIEEQFYLVWPLLLVVLLWMFRGRRTPALVLAAVAAVASFVLLWALAVPGTDVTRAYEGTDTRIGGILVGAVVALAMHGRGTARGGRAAGTLAGVVGLAGVLTVLVVSTDTGLGVFHWAILAVSVATALLAAAVSGAPTAVSALLGWAPLRWLGERSYGLYLWHMPAVAFLPRRGMDTLEWSLLVAGITLGLAELSWVLLEDPIRRHGLLATLRGGRAPEGDGADAGVTDDDVGVGVGEAAVGRASGAEVAAARARQRHAVEPGYWRPLPALSMLLVAGVALVAFAGSGPTRTTHVASATGVGGGMGMGPGPGSGAAAGPDAGAGRGAGAPAAFPAEPGTQPLSTSCRGVMHLGDSTSLGLMSESYLPDPADRIDAQYRQVGATDVRTDISGARSSVEGYQDQPNATVAAQGVTDGGWRGCWVAAIGTNDSANVVAGSTVGLRDRIDRIMGAVGDNPVMWLTLKTVEPNNSYYSEEGMSHMNDELLAACARYPRMRVYDWAAQVHDDWYTADGIHFTSEGYKERAHRIARALATAFPADGPPAPGCTVLPR